MDDRGRCRYGLAVVQPGSLMRPSPVRLADLAARHRQDPARTEALVLEVVRSGRWVGGPVVEAAERAAAGVFGREHAVGVASGTDALMLALQVAGVRAGHRVAVPALTFFATAGAVCAIGAVPVVVDVDERGLLDAEALSAHDDLRAVVPVHLFGNACTVAPVGTLVVDDAAQAAGCHTPGGELTAVSTYPTKTWSGLGDGGFVLTDDPELAAGVRRLGNHGLTAPHLHERVTDQIGRNSRLDAVSAAMLLGQLEHADERARRRRTIATIYDDELGEHVRPVRRDPENAVPVYCIQTARRDALVDHLHRAGVETAVYYPRPVHRQPALVDLGPVHAPTAERLATELLALPVHAGLHDTDVERVIAAVNSL